MNENQISKSPSGRMIITKKALNNIIQETINEIDGIECLKSFPFNLKDYILKAKKPTSMEVSIVEGTINLKLSVKCQKGSNILNMCEKSQNQIKDNIQSMTGFTVSKIDIYVNELGSSKEAKV